MDSKFAFHEYLEVDDITIIRKNFIYSKRDLQFYDPYLIIQKIEGLWHWMIFEQMRKYPYLFE